MMQQEEFGVLSFPGLGETSLFGGAWQKYWVKLSAQTVSFADSATGEGGTILLQDILAVMPEEVEGVNCLMLKVRTADDDEKCHRLRALPDENGQDAELLQEWKMSILINVENWHQKHDSFATNVAQSNSGAAGNSTAVELCRCAEHAQLESANKILEQKSKDTEAQLIALTETHRQAEHDQMEMVAKLEQMREQEVSVIAAKLQQAEEQLQQAAASGSNVEQREAELLAEVEALEQLSVERELAADCKVQQLADATAAQQTSEEVVVGLQNKIKELQQLHEENVSAQQIEGKHKLELVRAEGEKSLQAMREEIEQLKEKCAEQQASKQSGDAAEQISLIQTKLDVCEQEQSVAEEKSEALSAEISTLEDTLKQSEQQSIQLISEKEKMQKQIGALEKDNKGLLRQVDELESLLLDQDDDDDEAK